MVLNCITTKHSFISWYQGLCRSSAVAGMRPPFDIQLANRYTISYLLEIIS